MKYRALKEKLAAITEPYQLDQEVRLQDTESSMEFLVLDIEEDGEGQQVLVGILSEG